MDAIEGRVDRIEQSLSRLTSQVAGDGTDLSPGVVGLLTKQVRTTARHDERLDSVERTIDRARWTLGAWAVMGSAIGGGLVFLLTQWLGVTGQ